MDHQVNWLIVWLIDSVNQLQDVNIKMHEKTTMKKKKNKKKNKKRLCK